MPSGNFNLLWAIFWAAIGVAWSLASFRWLRAGVEKIGPPGTMQGSPIAQLAISKFIRLAGLAVLAYLALRMNVYYAVIMVVATTITRWVQVILYNQKVNRAGQKEDQP